MGLLDFFRSSKPLPVEEVAIPKGEHTQVDIVGESFYKDAFKELRTTFGASPGSERFVKVELRLEPGNPYAADGKAVAVYVHGLMVGHVDAYCARAAFDAIQAEGGIKTQNGRIYFGDLRESPPKNSVSINWTVQTKSPEENLKYERNYQKAQEKRAKDQEGLTDFLRNPTWSRHVLVEGDFVTFTGFSDWHYLSSLTESIIGQGEKSPKSQHLLVVHPTIERESAKLRNWLASKRPATNLSTFIECNPEFGKYFNPQTLEFEVPASISGDTPRQEVPTTSRVFETDYTLGSNPKKMPSDISLLQEQTLARHPSFTNYGSFSFKLSGLKESRAFIEELFAETGGGKTDAIVLRGFLKSVQVDGEARWAFNFRGKIIGYVPRNETTSWIRDAKNWYTGATLAIIYWDYKNNISGEHDGALTEAYRLF